MTFHIPTLEDLKRAVHLHEGIEKLKAELISLLGGTSGTGTKRGRKPGRKSASERLAISGDEIALIPDSSKKAAKKKKTKRVMSPEAREKIAAAQRKRWAKTKRAAKKAGQ